MLVVGTLRREPGPTLSIGMQQHRVPGKEYISILVGHGKTTVVPLHTYVFST
jgi:hypothetical protein